MGRRKGVIRNGRFDRRLPPLPKAERRNDRLANWATEDPSRGLDNLIGRSRGPGNTLSRSARIDRGARNG